MRAARHGLSVLQQSIAQCIAVNIAKLPELLQKLIDRDNANSMLWLLPANAVLDTIVLVAMLPWLLHLAAFLSHQMAGKERRNNQPQHANLKAARDHWHTPILMHCF